MVTIAVISQFFVRFGAFLTYAFSDTIRAKLLLLLLLTMTLPLQNHSLLAFSKWVSILFLHFYLFIKLYYFLLQNLTPAETAAVLSAFVFPDKAVDTPAGPTQALVDARTQVNCMFNCSWYPWDNSIECLFARSNKFIQRFKPKCKELEFTWYMNIGGECVILV